MIAPDAFHFVRPWWLLALLPLALVIGLQLRKRLHSGSWQAICDPRLLPHILIGNEKKKTRWSILMVGLVGMLAIIALAGPVWTQLPQPVFRTQSSLVIVLDLSRSMDAGDIKPSRITRARHKILDILEQRKEGQTALVVYAQDAFTVAPLTEDANTIALLVKSLETNLMPGQGSNVGLALKQANDLLQQAGSKQGSVLLVTDGVDDTAAFSAVTTLVNHGHSLSVLAVGTETGAPIPTDAGGFITDKHGDIVVSKLDESQLRSLASEGNGLYRILVSTDDDIRPLMSAFTDANMDKSISDEHKQLNVQADIWQEEGPWLLLLIIPFAVLVFRRGYLIMVFILVMPLPNTSHAFEWRDLWQTQDQQAAEAFRQGKHKEAAELFGNREWKAAAQYKANNYEAAVSSLGGLNTPDSLYNQGTALARSGAIEEAIEYYDRAIEMDPSHEDAIFNRDLLMKQQEKTQQEEQKKQNDEKKKDDQQGEGQDSDRKNQNSQTEKQGEGKDAGNKSKSETDESSDKDSENADSGDSEDPAASDKDQMNDSAREDDAGKKQMAQQESETGETEEQKKDKHDKAGKNPKDVDKKQQEMQMANEQWLRKIPDDPGGLLRRKFRYQSQLNKGKSAREDRPW